jgi:hypothetical protein
MYHHRIILHRLAKFAYSHMAVKIVIEGRSVVSVDENLDIFACCLL